MLLLFPFPHLRAPVYCRKHYAGGFTLHLRATEAVTTLTTDFCSHTYRINWEGEGARGSVLD
jgi:hypothetical protein